MKNKLLLIILTITLFSCSTEEDVIINKDIKQKSEELDIKYIPEIGDSYVVQIESDVNPEETRGEIKVTILCKNILNQGIHGDDWQGIGQDENGGIWIIKSTVSTIVNDDNKIIHVRHTTGYKWLFPWYPVEPC
jgi:hypothetical protein